MKITKQYLKQVIKEELARVVEQPEPDQQGMRKSVRPVTMDKKEALQYLNQSPDFRKEVSENPLYKAYVGTYQFGIMLEKPAGADGNKNPKYGIFRNLADQGSVPRWSGVANNVELPVHVVDAMTK